MFLCNPLKNRYFHDMEQILFKGEHYNPNTPVKRYGIKQTGYIADNRFREIILFFSNLQISMVSTHPIKWACLLLIIPFMACNPKPKVKQSSTIDIIAGTYTQNDSKGIYRLTLDTITGEIANVGLLAEINNPGYLDFSADKNVVYSVHEEIMSDGSSGGGVSSFLWDGENKTLSPQSYQSSQGDNPCYVSLNSKGTHLSVANYSSGNMAMFRLGNKGEILPDPIVEKHVGSGPDAVRQNAPHAHCSLWNPTGEYLYVVDLGIDQVLAYPFNKGTGSIGPGKTAIQVNGGAGPRHLAFHPYDNLAFLVNELNSTIQSMRYEAGNPEFIVVDKKSTLPEEFHGDNSVAHVEVAPDGKYVYVSNRGHNSIAIFSILESGNMTPIGHQYVKGDWPRFFTISPNGKHLLVANQKTNNVVVLQIDKASGKLLDTGHEAKVFAPVCLVFP